MCELYPVMCSGDFFIVAPAFYEVIELKKKKKKKKKKSWQNVRCGRGKTINLFSYFRFPIFLHQNPVVILYARILLQNLLCSYWVLNCILSYGLLGMLPPGRELWLMAFHKLFPITFEKMFFRLRDRSTEFLVGWSLELLTEVKTDIVSSTVLSSALRLQNKVAEMLESI